MNYQIHERHAHDNVEAVRGAGAADDACGQTGARLRDFKQARDNNALADTMAVVVFDEAVWEIIPHQQLSFGY